jgi:uncharacterized protein (UPF0147 family)
MFKKIYQYISLSNDRETIQKIIDKAHGNLILDLEDTVEDKQKAIQTLEQLSNNPNINIHLRIHDKTNLEYLNKTKIQIKEILVPKVRSSDEIENLRKLYPYYKYIAMIEDSISFNHKHDIISFCDGIHFGYYDYCLFDNIFPIEFDKEFERLQDELYQLCRSMNKKFISSPVRNTSILKDKLKNNYFNVSIVRHNQLKNLIPIYYYALDLIKKYEFKDEIFVKDENDFISTHEYKLAKKLIKDYYTL